LAKKLLRHVSISYLDTSLAEGRKAMGDSWTTVGLNQGMRNLMKQATELANYVTKESRDIKLLADSIYKVFQTKHGFEVFQPPALDMSGFLSNMKALERITDNFCSDPVNMLTEKHFLIRKFFLGLGEQTKTIFEQAEKECERWLEDVLSVLKNQMAEHKTSLEERSKNLVEAKSSAASLDSQLTIVEKEYASVAKESQALDTMLLQLVKAVKPAVSAKAAQKNNIDFDKTLVLPNMPFINVVASATDN
jgi:hypothetical protein